MRGEAQEVHRWGPPASKRELEKFGGHNRSGRSALEGADFLVDGSFIVLD